MKKLKCNRIGCNKNLGKKYIKTGVGNFCSEECRKEIEKNIFKILVNFPIKLQQYD